jgi:ABC-type lipoprotein release transport system permease subunit|tara:strand:+ start:1063 stop:1287 length:225 start_codon:yes stop_codon:yes gene_type:complete
VKTFVEFNESDEKLLNKIFSKLPKDSKEKKGNTKYIYATGDLATALGVKDYDKVELSSVTTSQAEKLAKMFKVT